MSKKANYNYKTDYMKITPFGVTYMKKGEKVHKPFDVNYYDLRRQLKEIRYDDFYESIGGKNAYSEKVERMDRAAFGPIPFTWISMLNKDSSSLVGKP